MNPIEFPEQNVVYSPAKGDEENVMPLGVRREMVKYADGRVVPTIISCWEPTDEERKQIALGAPVWLHVFGESPPPVYVGVANPFITEDEILDGTQR